MPRQTRKHVDNEVLELASWLPVTWRTWKSIVRERGDVEMSPVDPSPELEENAQEGTEPMEVGGRHSGRCSASRTHVST